MTWICSSDWMLGLRDEGPRSIRHGGDHGMDEQEVGWASEAFDALRQACRACEIVRMAGDEVPPQMICRTAT